MGNHQKINDDDTSSTIRLGGLDMNFPFVPYGIQKAMLAKIAVTLTNKEHSLIESPTGTGKTLVLLCASLAWHRQSKIDKTPLISTRLRNQIASDRSEKLRNRPCSCGNRPNKTTESDELDDLKEAKKKKYDLCDNCQAIKIEDDYNDELGHPAARVRLSKIPRIYYGTRTHKQISQVVRELKKTVYKEDLKMCILSSRDRTCVNDEVKDQVDRNDRCQELIKNYTKSSTRKSTKAPDTCSYYRDSNALAVEFERIYEDFKGDAWDIEEAVKFGKDSCLCPYYGIRAIQDQADITFCPYNYLLDPNIRKALNINLNNAVIIFDEAHNIEDICRDSASFIIDSQQIDDILATINRALTHYVQGSTVHDAYTYFKNLFLGLKARIINFEYTTMEAKQDGDCLARHILSRVEMMQILEQLRLGSKNLKDIKQHVGSIRGEEDESSEKRNEDAQDAALSNAEMQFITQLANTLDFMHGSNGKYCDDFKCIVSKHLERFRPNFRNSKNTSTTGDVHLHRFSLLCMNSGIAFEKIHSLAWSVIVASGTLSPVESLKTELGCHFAHVFEGSHVIGDERIFATILSHGPNRIDLNCAYQNSLRLDFQDEIGVIVRDVCQSVPNGVLVFFPSYDRMENLYQRWFTKGYIKDIQKCGKKLFREQKNFTAAKFEDELQKYHRCAKAPRGGALLFAVFRGKVSEGIDFSDTAARAVITVGIPYPNIREITIGLKKEYNDNARREKPHLMTGRDWYASQAFRALNQALGRCIRHKEDWGAIIMIDSRLRDSYGLNNISKWIRRVVSTPNDYSLVRRGLESFVAQRMGDVIQEAPSNVKQEAPSNVKQEAPSNVDEEVITIY